MQHIRYSFLLLAASLMIVPLALAEEPLPSNWFGNRTWLAERGITFDLDVGNFYHGVTSGGLSREFKYGGHGDYVMNVDFGKLCEREGLFLKIRAEHRFGQTINGDTGALLPATVSPGLPVGNSEELYLTNVLITQALSEQFVVFLGKLDTLDGDANAYAHGRGKTQFSNVGFVANPIALRTIPYSTLGCGFAVLGEGGEPLFSYTLLNAVDTTKTDGFNELFAKGVAMSAELRLPTNFLGLPGHQLFAGTWNSREFVELGQDPRVVLPNIPINESTGSWSLYWNFDQALCVDSCDPTKHWGLFGRAGIADEDTNPISWFLSCGIGGHNLMQGHKEDTFGIGWFISGKSNEIGTIAQAYLGPIDDGQAVELFYNCQVTPNLNITPDFQVIIPARENVETAVAVGVRAVLQL